MTQEEFVSKKFDAINSLAAFAHQNNSILETMLTLLIDIKAKVESRDRNDVKQEVIALLETNQDLARDLFVEADDIKS